MDDRQFRVLLDWFGFSWEGYRRVRKGARKRVRRHMETQGRNSLNDYLALLQERPDQRREAERMLAVPISRFFRDLAVWQALDGCVLPEVLRRHPVKVWSAGCARGEEAYSFKILWEDRRRRGTVLPGLILRATDLNPEMILQARAGIYPASSLREVPEPWGALYFDPLPGGPSYAISEAIKKGIHWSVHDLLCDAPPETSVDILFLRNSLLTYVEADRVERPLHRVLSSVGENGFLVIGAREALPSFVTEFTASRCHPKIFRKVQLR